ncbi:hypothetical protein Vadar_014933 [Vaccinium darrowii]|uniref:Uncharacterized protein n=1 Tax=Vaccinium darrowii TaxID=229202 RepID=A0ACB7ZKN2_9ERIC|nr:hypothetical protein Vadar_014933 [Vaccinium darrowii]
MVKRKHSATKKTGFDGPPKVGSGPSQKPVDKDTGNQPPPDDEGDDERNKKRREDEAAEKKRKWVKKTMSRNFTCERQIKCHDMEGNPLIAAVQRQGLSFYFKEVPGYRPKTVKQFYCNMEVDRNKFEITSRVGTKTIVVTPDTIAAYLGKYERPHPDSITFPKGPLKVKQDDFLKTLMVDPTSFDFEEKRFPLGGLNELPRSLNKIVHYNLIPHSNEKRLKWRDAEVLYAFGSETQKVDWAKFIWIYMYKFWRKGSINGKIPFPAMVTKLCENAGCKPKDDPIEPGYPGPYNSTSLKKSKSLSKPPRPETVASTKPTAKTVKERNEQWFELLFSRQGLIMGKQEEQDTRLKRLERMVAKIGRVCKYLANKEGERSEDPYVETMEDLEVDTDVEEDGGECDYDLEDDDDEGEDIPGGHEYRLESDEEGDDDQ